MAEWVDIKRGDTAVRLSEEHGFFHRTIWDHPTNAELKGERADANVLAPGDRLFIPDLTPKSVAAVTDRQHVYRRKGIPAIVRMQMLEDGQPRAGVGYELTVDGRSRRGTTSDAGYLQEWVAASAVKGTLKLDDSDEIYTLQFGHLDPEDSVEGAQQRLNNMGYDAGPVDGEAGERTLAAVRRFQADRDLEVTGELDEATADALRRLHDEQDATDDDSGEARA